MSAASVSVVTRPAARRILIVMLAMALRIPAAIAALLVLACDPTENEPEPETGECAAGAAASASFTIDVGGWPATGDELEISAPCTVGAAGSTVTLACEDADETRTVTLQLTASPELVMPLRAGDVVDFELRRKADATPDRGFWAVRDGEGALLLGGAHSFSSTPSGAADFFAPLALDVDFKVCEERKTDSCRLEQKVVLEVADSAGTTRVPNGAAATLPSGHQVVVERAMLSMSSGDPKVCPLDESTPETYQYLIAAPAR